MKRIFKIFQSLKKFEKFITKNKKNESKVPLKEDSGN